METTRAPHAESKSVETPWLGPHFYVDLIRLARKGWPTLARVAYLSTLLLSMTFMYQTQGQRSQAMKPGEYAVLAHEYALTLIVMQNLLILVLMPVYVASAIAQEKENQTLEALTLTHLSDRELVLGKLFGRLAHLGAIALSSLPLLAFMHLWGNVDLSLIIYHETNTLLLLFSAGSVCILISTSSESVFQAVSGSYPWLALMALFGVGGAFALPYVVGAFTWTAGGDPTPSYLPALFPLVVVHGVFCLILLQQAILRMERFRKEERKTPKKATTALLLTDKPIGPEPRTGKRGETRSRIHPWAWPVTGDALWWKECIKDGTSASLSVRWVFIALAIVVAVAIPWGIVRNLSVGNEREGFSALANAFTYTFYVVALAAYALVVLLQLTTTVAGEREHDTLTTLLMIPEDRRRILFAKWMGPWWRNWPILAVSWLGVIFGLGSGLFGFLAALLLLLAPLPFLLMIGGMALWLSVMCRRVLYANIAVVGILGLLLLAHIAAGVQARAVLSFYVATIGGTHIDELVKGLTWAEASTLALGELAIFLLVGVLCVVNAFRVFSRRDYAGA